MDLEMEIFGQDQYMRMNRPNSHLPYLFSRSEELDWLNTGSEWLKTLYIEAKVDDYELYDVVRKVTHSNVHFILERTSLDQPEDDFYEKLITQTSLIQALPASSVQTLTCPTAGRKTVKTIFDCDDSLLDKWNEYLGSWARHTS